MSDDVNIKISATDNATATLRAVQAELGKFSSSIKGIAGLTVAGLGVRELASFATDSFKAYAESERAVTMLDRVLKSTGNTIKMTRQEIQAYADARMQQTAFDDDAIVEAASQLARFRDLSGDTFTATLDAAQDLATVMGTDLVSATQMLGRALSDPADGLAKLARAGVLFTDSQKEQIKLLDTIGDKAGQQKIILAELQRQFGGAAVQDASTASGQIQQLSNAIGELKEAIGKTLAGAILPLIKSITGNDGMTLADKAIAASGVEVRADKVSERADLEKQIAELDSRVRQLQAENLDSQQGLVSSLFGRGRRLGQEKIDELRAVARLRMSQLEGIDATATAQAAGQAQAARMQAANRQQNMAFFGNIAQGAVGGVANGLAEANAEDVGAAIGAQVRGMFFGQNWWQKQQQQQRDQSLVATESRFLTRGRGVMTEADRKNLEEQRKQTEYLKRIEKAFANFTSGENLLFVEGVN